MNAEIDFNDYGFCPSCKTVNLKSAEVCRACGKTVSMKDISSNNLKNFRQGLGCLVGVIGIALLFAEPISGIVVLIISSGVMSSGTNQAKYAENSLKRQAIDLFEHTASSQLTSAKEAEVQGIQAIRAGKFAEASEHLENAVQLGRIDPFIRFMLAVSYYNLGQHSEAIPILEELVQVDDPTDEADLSALPELLARCYLTIGIHDEKQVQHLLKFMPEFGPKFQDRIKLSLAKYFRDARVYDDVAKSVMLEAVEIAPKDPEYRGAIAELFLAVNDPGSAAELCQELPVEEHSDYSVSHYARALSLINDLSDAAIRVYERSLAVDPRNAEIRLRLAQAYIKQGELEKAIQTYSVGLANDRNDVRLRYHLALTYMMYNRLEDAIGELQALMRMDDFDTYRSRSDIIRLLGRCFVRKGMLQAALKMYLQADRSMDTLDSLYELGEEFERVGDTKGSRACWEEIYATDVRFRNIASRIG
jgi:thioredoxin-like negative regulator of GroEL